MTNVEDQKYHIKNEIFLIIEFQKSQLAVDDMHMILFFLILYTEDQISVEKVGENDLNEFIDLTMIGLNANDSYIILDTFKHSIKRIKREQIITLLEQFDKNLGKVYLNDYLPFVFDEFLYRILKLQGKLREGILQPKQLTSFVTNYFDNSIKNVFNPFSGLGSFLLFGNEQTKYHAQELNPKTWSIGKLRLSAFKSKAEYKLEDSIENWPDNQKFDLIVSHPPFKFRIAHSKYKYVEDFLLNKGIDLLNNKGKLIVVLPSNFLLSSRKEDKKLRERLIEEDLIESVFLFPEGLLDYTGIKFSVLILDKDKKNNGQVRFIDASMLKKSVSESNHVIDINAIEAIKNTFQDDTLIRIVTNKTIKNEEYNLDVKRYFFINEDGHELKKFIEYFSNVNVRGKQFGKLVQIKNLKNDVFDYTLNENGILDTVFEASNAREITESCILISMVGKYLKPTYFDFKEIPIFISNNIATYRLIPKSINLEYLFFQLNSEKVRKQAFAFGVDSAVSALRRRDFERIKIALPESNEFKDDLLLQEEVVYSKKIEFYKKEQAKLKKQKEELKIDVADENSFLRHEIAGSLANVRRNFKFLKRVVDGKVRDIVPEVYSLNSKPNSSNLGDYLKRIDRDLKLITKSVNKVGTNLSLLDIDVEEINLIRYIKEYAKELKESSGGRYNVRVNIDEIALIDNNIESIFIDGDKELLRKILDNIIENANKHGFQNKIDTNNLIEFDLLFDFQELSVQLDISNTGTPLPENYSHDDFIRRGSSTGDYSGDGLGGWFINEVMKLHNGNFGFTDETGEEGINMDNDYSKLVTTIELTFPIKIY